MQVVIISDIHNNQVNLQKVLDYCRLYEIDRIICCGDLASMETLDFLNDNFRGEIYFAFGNMDDDYLKNCLGLPIYKHTRIYENFGEIEITGKQIAFVHYPKAAKVLAETEKYAFVFYGHTHKPWEETVGNCKLLNPGNVAGEIYPPTFAVWNTENDKFDLIRVHELK